MTSPSRRPPSASPSRTTDLQIEVLYNTSVQFFVRRDHSTTQATLARLLKQLRSQKRDQTVPWYDLTRQAKDEELEGWLVKALKLVISSHVSLYTDPPRSTSTLPADIRGLLPPSSSDKMLRHVKQLCDDTYFSPSSPEPHLLPPPLVSTLLLASLKLSLPFAHTLAEDWIAPLPDSFIFAISPERHRPNGNGPLKPDAQKRVEAAREGYLKVVELFVGEVLAREGEWEMARGFLEGEALISSKRKENLYRHLRAVQTKPRSVPSSPANSAILPSPSSPKPNGRTRSRSSSTSSSSSERTARPNTVNGRTTPAANGDRSGGFISNGDRKGKKARGRSSVVEQERDHRNESSVPSKIYVNHPVPPSRATSSSSRGNILDSALSFLPRNLQARIRAMSTSDWLASTIAIPLPIIFLVVSFLAIRRRLARRNLGTPAAVPGTATLATQAIDDIRARLMRARGRGLLQWVTFWLRWWAERFAGVWKLGTTVTYV